MRSMWRRRARPAREGGGASSREGGAKFLSKRVTKTWRKMRPVRPNQTAIEKGLRKKRVLPLEERVDERWTMAMESKNMGATKSTFELRSVLRAAEMAPMSHLQEEVFVFGSPEAGLGAHLAKWSTRLEKPLKGTKVSGPGLLVVLTHFKPTVSSDVLL